MTSGWQGAAYFRSYDRQLVSKLVILLNNCWGGFRRTTLFVVTNGPRQEKDPSELHPRY